MTISRKEFASFGLDFDDDQLAGIRAGAEQICAALAEAETWDCRREYPALQLVPDIRTMTNGVLNKHRKDRIMGSVVEWKYSQGGQWLPQHNVNNPDHAGKVFGIFAGHLNDLHVLGGEYTVERFLGRYPEEHVRECDWNKFAYLWPWSTTDTILFNHADVGGPPREVRYLLFAQGQYLIAVATCRRCVRWLLEGGSLDAP